MRSPSHAAGSLDVAGGSVGTSAEVVVSARFTSPENATKVADALRPLALSRAG